MLFIAVQTGDWRPIGQQALDCTQEVLRQLVCALRTFRAGNKRQGLGVPSFAPECHYISRVDWPQREAYERLSIRKAWFGYLREVHAIQEVVRRPTVDLDCRLRRHRPQL